MSNGAAELRSLLKDVSLAGAIIIDKKKLLWLLGWGQDRAGAWKGLLEHWVELGEDEATLYGMEVHDKIVLSWQPGRLVPIKDWAKAS